MTRAEPSWTQRGFTRSAYGLYCIRREDGSTYFVEHLADRPLYDLLPDYWRTADPVHVLVPEFTPPPPAAATWDVDAAAFGEIRAIAGDALSWVRQLCGLNSPQPYPPAKSDEAIRAVRALVEAFESRRNDIRTQRSRADESARAANEMGAENEKLRSDLERVTRERDFAVNAATMISTIHGQTPKQEERFSVRLGALELRETSRSGGNEPYLEIVKWESKSCYTLAYWTGPDKDGQHTLHHVGTRPTDLAIGTDDVMDEWYDFKHLVRNGFLRLTALESGDRSGK